MKQPNRKIAIVLALFAMMFCCADISAKNITCSYQINEPNFPYKILSVVYSTDSNELEEIKNKEKPTYHYLMYYQFDDGTKHALEGNLENASPASLWDGSSFPYLSFISLKTWRNSGCLENIYISSNTDHSSIAFSSNSLTAEQSKLAHINTSFPIHLNYNSEKGYLHTVILRGSEYEKIITVYDGDKISIPSPTETGIPLFDSEGNQLCWVTEQGACWDFDSVITSDITLSATYKADRGESTEGKSGFKFSNKKVNCAGEEIPYGAPYIVHNIINLLKIITPIVLIILGMVDFTRAVVASDEKQMKEASTKFIRRIFAAVVVFFVVVIVQFAFSLLGSNDESALGCFNCFVNGACSPYSDTSKPGHGGSSAKF